MTALIRPTEPHHTWHLDELLDLTVPADAADHQTGGTIWKMWNVANSPMMAVVYGMAHAGTRTGAHRHPDTAHYSVCVQGTGLVYIEGEMVRLSAGDILYTPIGALHDFGADTTDDLWIVDLNSPPYDPEKMLFEPEMEEQIAKAFATAWTDPQKAILNPFTAGETHG